MSVVCFIRREWESADEARLITVKTGRWVHGFVVLFSLLLYIFEISIMRTFFLSRSWLNFFHLCNSFLLYFENWLICVATWNLAHTLFSIPYKNPLIYRADLLFYLEVVWLLLVPGNAKKWWMLALQALGSPTMRKTPKMPPKPLRIACKKSRGTFQSISMGPPAFTWGPQLGCDYWGKSSNGPEKPVGPTQPGMCWPFPRI